MTSLLEDLKKTNNMVRDSESIENNLHWMRNVNFIEDASRRMKGYLAENFNFIGKVTLPLITNTPVEKPVSKSKKRYSTALGKSF